MFKSLAASADTATLDKNKSTGDDLLDFTRSLESIFMEDGEEGEDTEDDADAGTDDDDLDLGDDETPDEDDTTEVEDVTTAGGGVTVNVNVGTSDDEEDETSEEALALGVYESLHQFDDLLDTADDFTALHDTISAHGLTPSLVKFVDRDQLLSSAGYIPTYESLIEKKVSKSDVQASLELLEGGFLNTVGGWFTAGFTNMKQFGGWMKGFLTGRAAVWDKIIARIGVLTLKLPDNLMTAPIKKAMYNILKRMVAKQATTTSTAAATSTAVAVRNSTAVILHDPTKAAAASSAVIPSKKGLGELLNRMRGSIVAVSKAHPIATAALGVILAAGATFTIVKARKAKAKMQADMAKEIEGIDGVNLTKGATDPNSYATEALANGESIDVIVNMSDIDVATKPEDLPSPKEITGFLGKVKKWLSDLFKAMLDGTKKFLSGAKNIIMKALKGGAKAVWAAVKFCGSIIRTTLGFVWKVVKSIAMGIAGAVTGMVSGIVSVWTKAATVKEDEDGAVTA